MNYTLKEYFERMANNNMIGHAFLIGNTSYQNIKEELEEVINKYFFNDNISLDNSLDVLFIKPENDKIIKSAILDLQDKFKTYSQVNDNKVYIIDQSEKMNDYAANSLLKFLEEPEDNIYAFLITENIQRILPTIKSRCQVITVGNSNVFDLDKYDSDFVRNVIDFLNTFEENGIDTIAYINDYFNKKEDKDIIMNMISISKYFYRDVLNYLYYNEIKYFSLYEDFIKSILKNNTVEKITNKLIVLSKAENMLQYNVNLGLFMDKLIIDLGRC